MQVGEFFISLGVKGATKAMDAIGGVAGKMGDLTSTSLAAKAAILAAVYAFTRMSESTAKSGSELKNFTALTGISSQTLQKWQYAAQQVGVGSEEVASNFKSVQQALAGLNVGKVPEGLNYLTSVLNKHGEQFDPARALKDTEYAMQQMQKFAAFEPDVNKRNMALKGMGLSENMIAGMNRQAFKPEVMAKAPTLSDKEIDKLAQVNAAWANLKTKVDMAFAQFNAKHGKELVDGITKIITQVIKLVEVFMKLANVIHLFDGIAKVLGLVSKGLGFITGGAEQVANAATDPKKAAELKQQTLGFFKEMPSVLGVMAHDVASSIGSAISPTPALAGGAPPTPKAFGSPAVNPAAIAPKMGQAPVQKNSTSNHNVNQTFHFGPNTSDHKQVGDSAGKAVSKAYFQYQNANGLGGH